MVMAFCCIQETFKKYVRSRFLIFDHSPVSPSSPLFVFEQPPAPLTSHPPPFPPSQSTFVLARTPPLPHNFYTREIQRKEVNAEYQYLWSNSMCLLRSHSLISIKWTPLVHDKSVRFMEISALQRVHLKIRSLQK